MARKAKSSNASSAPRGDGRHERDAEVRIIGGKFRGRRLRYHGDPVVRPMKHRTREAIFDLVTTDAANRHAIDLFAGTGALGLEALSRGATSATFIEKHVPSARVIEENIRTLDVADRAKLLITSAFLWAKRDLPNEGQSFATPPQGEQAPAESCPKRGVPWLVFCSPPYVFYHERRDEMLELVHRIQQFMPTDSVLVVEADATFDFEHLCRAEGSGVFDQWNIRHYAPAVVGIWRKE